MPHFADFFFLEILNSHHKISISNFVILYIWITIISCGAKVKVSICENLRCLIKKSACHQDIIELYVNILNVTRTTFVINDKSGTFAVYAIEFMRLVHWGKTTGICVA